MIDSNQSTIDSLKDQLDYFEENMKIAEQVLMIREEREAEYEPYLKNNLRTELKELVQIIERMQLEGRDPKRINEAIKKRINSTIEIFL